MPMHDEVMRFISRFTQGGANQGTIDTFTCGCCYWFAHILSVRFFNLNAVKQDIELMYDPIANHFACRIGDIVYDITGDVTDKYDWEPLNSVLDEDSLLRERLLRDCIRF